MSTTRARLLYVITDLELGGVPLHLVRLARHVRQQGFNATVVCLSRPGPVSELLAREGVRTEACGARGVWNVAALARLRDVIRSVDPDLIHTFLFHANVATRWVARSVGFDADRLICELQTVEIERRWHLPIERWTQRWCRCIVGNSPSVIEHLQRVGRIAPDRLRLVMGGVDVDLIRAAEPIPRRELGWPDELPVILWVGRMDPIKGLDVLIQAVARVRAERPCLLALVGAGAARSAVDRAIASTGLREHVRLLGPRTDVPRLLRAADLFAFPSRTEGLPNALLEAMAAGLPIVTTDAPGCRDVIRHGLTGLLVPPDNVERLAEAILALLGDPKAAGQLGQAGAEDARNRFGIARMFADYEALYAEVLGNRSTPA